MEYNTKILIADENHNQRMALRDGLMRAGYRYIEEAVNGEDALIKLNRFHPDIALVDISLLHTRRHLPSYIFPSQLMSNYTELWHLSIYCRMLSDQNSPKGQQPPLQQRAYLT